MFGLDPPHSSDASGIHDAPPIDDSILDAPPDDVPPDACVSTSAYLPDLCALAAVAGTLTVNTTQTVNTDADARCQQVSAIDGTPLCLFYYETISIDASAMMSAAGERVLALYARTSLSIGGTIDVSSSSNAYGAGAGPAGVARIDCTERQLPEADGGGAGGGAGGSFAFAGGRGGVGDQNASTAVDGTGIGGRPASAALPAAGHFAQGCNGEDGGTLTLTSMGGRGGYPGGVIYLGAGGALIVSATGRVRANGGAGLGGQAAHYGGGGGGPGGLIVIEAASQAVNGHLNANGGAGGGGGGTGQPGGNGADGVDGPSQAMGGVGGISLGGSGGAGGINNTVGAGGDANAGGGGGGGGGGAIVINSLPLGASWE